VNGRDEPYLGETSARAEFLDDEEPDRNTCPSGKILKRAARRHKIINNIYPRFEGDEVGNDAVGVGENACITPRRGANMGIYVEPAHAPLSEEMIATIDTNE
jgi:hypothetical protein